MPNSNANSTSASPFPPNPPPQEGFEALKRAVQNDHAQNDKAPARYIVLYKYINFGAFENTLDGWSMKATIPHEANDPYECYPHFPEPVDLNDEGLQRISQHLEIERKRNTDGLAFISLSRSMCSAAMWGHYADACKGVCLAFRLPVKQWNGKGKVPSYVVDDDHLYEVHYSHGRVKREHGEHPDEYHRRLIATKDISWKYEQEYRLIFEVAASDYVGKGIVCYKSIMRYLVGVIVGHRCEHQLSYIRRFVDQAVGKARRQGFLFYWSREQKLPVFLSAPDVDYFRVISPKWEEHCTQWKKDYPYPGADYDSGLLQGAPQSPVSPKRAAHLFTEAVKAEMGISDEFLHHTDGVPDARDSVRRTGYAMNQYLQAAEAGEAHAQAALCFHYFMAESNLDEAGVWGEKAAANNNAAALRYLGDLHHAQGLIQSDVNELAQARPLYERGANCGDAACQLQLGICYRDGHGGAQDMDAALYWFEKAAEQDIFEAQLMAGDLLASHFKKQGGSRKAAYWYKRAADLGSPRGMSILGDCYLFGRGVQTNYTEAFLLFQRAADAGDIIAYTQLGYCYENGIGTVVDIGKAVELYQKGVQADYPPAMVHLGIMYEKGKVGKPDRDKALMYYSMAEEKGQSLAKKRKEALLAKK